MANYGQCTADGCGNVGQYKNDGAPLCVQHKYGACAADGCDSAASVIKDGLPVCKRHKYGACTNDGCERVGQMIHEGSVVCTPCRRPICSAWECGNKANHWYTPDGPLCEFHNRNGIAATAIRAGKIRNTDHYVYVIAFDRYHQVKVGLSIGSYRPETIAKRNGGKVLALVAVGKHAEARHAERTLLNLLDNLGGLSVSLEATSCADDGHTEWREIEGAEQYDVAKVAVLDRLAEMAV